MSGAGSADPAACGSLPAGLVRLSAVPGSPPHRTNDVLLLRPGAARQEGGAHVVFFPGDIQDFEQEMSLRPEAAPFLPFCLERVAAVLGARFPGRHVWLVRPSRVHLHKFARYANFVASDAFGAPLHSSDHGAVRHLRALLGRAMELAGIVERPPPSPEGAPGLAPLPPGSSLVVVGFSKGCVVLNQLVHELASARADAELGGFLDRVSDMYWLDGGHPGTGETWVTDRRALRELAASGVAVHAHVTPYEVRDPARPWVGREHGRFVRTLAELGVRVTGRMHFGDEPASITNHFRVVEEF